MPSLQIRSRPAIRRRGPSALLGQPRSWSDAVLALSLPTMPPVRTGGASPLGVSEDHGAGTAASAASVERSV